MQWVILSYSLPAARSNSSARVAIWRRLKRIGVISPIGGLQVLPAREACIEAFNWLAQEIRQDGGEALIMHCDQFEGLTTEQIISLFCEARSKDYQEIAAELEQSTAAERAILHKLRKQHSEIKNIDYFNCPEGLELEKKLDAYERALRGEHLEDIRRASIESYQGKVWVTRPRPHVDRLASAWLIRQFIDSNATIRYSPEPAPHEIGFDMPEGEFTHHGNFCTFETLIRAFGLEHDTALLALAEVVHEIDLRDSLYQRPEVPGIEAILQGWLLNNLSDQQLETHGITLFGGLYAAFTYQQRGKQ